jgi:hypothetical protein
MVNGFSLKPKIKSWDKAYKQYYASKVTTYKISDEELLLILNRIKPDFHPSTTIGFKNSLKYKYKQIKKTMCR